MMKIIIITKNPKNKLVRLKKYTPKKQSPKNRCTDKRNNCYFFTHHRYPIYITSSRVISNSSVNDSIMLHANKIFYSLLLFLNLSWALTDVNSISESSYLVTSMIAKVFYPSLITLIITKSYIEFIFKFDYTRNVIIKTTIFLSSLVTSK